MPWTHLLLGVWGEQGEVEECEGSSGALRLWEHMRPSLT